MKYCKEHGIKAIEKEEERLRKCTLIPDSGIKILQDGEILKIYPALKEGFHLSQKAASRLGRYRRINNSVIFVCRDGRTYLGDWPILKHLNHANYQIGRGTYFENLPDFRTKDVIIQH